MILSSKTEEKITELLSGMTREEKIGQLNQQPLFADMETLKAGVRKGEIGSLVLAYTPFAGVEQHRDVLEEREELKRIALYESRLGIPLLMGRDVIHGHRTVFPIPLAQAAAWEPDLVGELAACAGREARAEQVDWTFAPMLDIARDPRWGRIVEGFGESGFLAAQNAAAAVRGFQEGAGIAACAKHFLGYGFSEGGRDYSGADISPMELYNVVLRPFAAAVEAGVDSVMVSFNDINGQSLTGSHYYLTELLKEKLGFSGLVVSDWNAVAQLVNQGIALDLKDAVRIAFNAGVDMDMCSGGYIRYLSELIDEGKCGLERLDDAVRRVLRVKLSRASSEEISPCLPDRSLALRAALSSIVLLKNDRAILPLKPGSVVDLYGLAASDARVHLGSWTLDGRSEDSETFLSCLEKNCVCHYHGENGDAPANGPLAIVVLDEPWDHTGEARGSHAPCLSSGQIALVQKVSSHHDLVVTVLFAGRPICISGIEPCSQAIVYAWHSGICASEATVKLLFGECSPSGKLPVTLPGHPGQIPLHYDQRPGARNIDCYYGQGDIPSYLAFSSQPLYPFGHGLCYTSFTYDSLSCDKTSYTIGETVTLRFYVQNTGSVPGTEICQCYIRGFGGERVWPLRTLRGFTRQRLEAGEGRWLTFSFPAADLYLRDAPEKRHYPQRVQAWVGGSSYAGLSVCFSLLI